MLDSLLIKNFRSLEHLDVPKLGRVNLMVGKNNCGKSTVLEALRIYAGNAQRPLLEAIAQEHDERYRARESETLFEDSLMPFQDFFPGREFPPDEKAIEIGSINAADDRLRVSHELMEESMSEPEEMNGEMINRIRRRYIPKSQANLFPSELQQVILVRKGDRLFHPLKLINGARRPAAYETSIVPCSFIPTQFISMDVLGDEWDRIVFTEQEAAVKRALLVIEPSFENLTFVRAEGYTPPHIRSRSSRTAMVKLKGVDRPVPLNSMGDGMLRVLQLSLKLFAAKGGFLLIEEFENGLHYSVQEKVWDLLFEMAERHNIQIFATTHSWDCIESFTKVAVDRKQTDGVLFRLGRSVRTSDQGRVIATVFDEAALQNITQADVEVR
jgi:AAA15 family ATPase/GTPase